MLWEEASSTLGSVISQTVSTEKGITSCTGRSAAQFMGVVGFFCFFHRNTCVLYLRLATHSFVFMGEEDDETLSFKVFLSCHVKHSSQIE